ncbi:polynucleotide adenylyltransferase [Helicobacter burdigaliensis]|uniref:polynucleotide adenylyltransferase n=1 Tax=Helicobacter burdigaliensis TaxID=2315334 RepID=UPI001E2BF7A6|nr:polynucleotide adenylyltransferase [Helicobacter burdigaliensis]
MASTKKIYLVGGAVRDMLLKLPLKDKDYVAVGYTQQDFSHLKKVGKSFPVFLLDNSTQIALARKEFKISKGYNGFSYDAQNISLKEDLKRRDLTINALAYDEEKKEIIDYFGGLEDLKNKILRHVSGAFCEDPLRILRLARFRARFGEEWSIHQDTKKLVYSMRDTLKELEPNRVYKEIENVMQHKNSTLFFATLIELRVLEYIFPNLYKTPTLLENLNLLKKLDNKNLLLKFTSLFLNTVKIDLQIPKKTLIPLLLLLRNQDSFKKLAQLSPKDLLQLLEEYKDMELLKQQIRFYNAKENLPLNAKWILSTYKRLKKYSIKEWLIAQKQPIAPLAIKEKVYQDKCNLLLECLKNIHL